MVCTLGTTPPHVGTSPPSIGGIGIMRGATRRQPAPHATNPHRHRYGGRRRDCRALASFEARRRRARLRRPWAAAGPGRASSRRAEPKARSADGSRAGRRPRAQKAARPDKALRRPEHPWGYKQGTAGRRPRAHQAARPHAAPGTPVAPEVTPRPQPGNARRSSPSEPCARAGASRPGRSEYGPRCAAPRLQYR